MLELATISRTSLLVKGRESTRGKHPGVEGRRVELDEECTELQMQCVACGRRPVNHERTGSSMDRLEDRLKSGICRKRGTILVNNNTDRGTWDLLAVA